MDTKACREEFEEWIKNVKDVDAEGKQLAWTAYQACWAKRKSRQAAAIVTAARNLVRQKGRHNTEQAYQQLVEAIDAEE